MTNDKIAYLTPQILNIIEETAHYMTLLKPGGELSKKLLKEIMDAVHVLESNFNLDVCWKVHDATTNYMLYLILDEELSKI